MDLKALDVGYNSIIILLSSPFFNFNRQYISSNFHFRSRHVSKHHRARFKPKLKPFECLGSVYRGA
jgi:hypothetical protein